MPLLATAAVARLVAAGGNVRLIGARELNAFRLAKLFPDLRQTNGGLVLIGITPEGAIEGIPAPDLDPLYARFERLCSELTQSRVQIGTLRLDCGRTILYLLFNTIPANLDRLAPVRAGASRVVMV